MNILFTVLLIPNRQFHPQHGNTTIKLATVSETKVQLEVYVLFRE